MSGHDGVSFAVVDDAAREPGGVAAQFGAKTTSARYDGFASLISGRGGASQ